MLNTQTIAGINPVSSRTKALGTISTVLCQKALSDIFFGIFTFFADYDTTPNCASRVKFVQVNCTYKWCFLTFKHFSERT